MSSEDDHLSVWNTAQRPAPGQRAGRYVRASTDHPAKMLPAIAQRAIAIFAQPGEWVLDPMCGIGTTLVEAVHLGRHAVGIEYETRWTLLARANLALARSQHAAGHGRVLSGDARRLTDLVNPARRFSLLLTSPPYGASTHGQVKPGPGAITKWAGDYAPTRRSGSLAREDPAELRDSLTEILTAARHVLRPGGFVALTARPWRRHGELIDLPAAITTAAHTAGLIPHERLVALLAGLRAGALVPRASFFQLLNIRTARARGVPLHLIAHEDLLIFRTPTEHASQPEDPTKGENP